MLFELHRSVVVAGQPVYETNLRRIHLYHDDIKTYDTLIFLLPFKVNKLVLRNMKIFSAVVCRARESTESSDELTQTSLVVSFNGAVLVRARKAIRTLGPRQTYSGFNGAVLVRARKERGRLVQEAPKGASMGPCS